MLMYKIGDRVQVRRTVKLEEGEVVAVNDEGTPQVRFSDGQALHILPFQIVPSKKKADSKASGTKKKKR
jgi:hypothetical protein